MPQLPILLIKLWYAIPSGLGIGSILNLCWNNFLFSWGLLFNRGLWSILSLGELAPKNITFSFLTEMCKEDTMKRVTACELLRPSQASPGESHLLWDIKLCPTPIEQEKELTKELAALSSAGWHS